MSRIASRISPRLRGRAAQGAVVLLGILALAWGAPHTARSSPVSLDDRVYAVSRQLMCPVCQGQTVAESDSALAREMRAIIRQKLLAGESPDQIVRYFTAQFGDSVLAEPRPGGVSLILYAGPPLALIAGAVIVAVFLRRTAARSARRGIPPDGEPGVAAVDDA